MKMYYQRRIAEGKHHMSTLNIIRNKLVSRVFAAVNRNSYTGTSQVRHLTCTSLRIPVGRLENTGSKIASRPKRSQIIRGRLPAGRQAREHQDERSRRG